MSKVLHLTIKKPWYDLIKAGLKTEEYREIKPYWAKRLSTVHKGAIGGDLFLKNINAAFVFKDFDSVIFYNGGYCSDKLPNFTVKCNGIEIIAGKTEWGAEPGKKYFVIKLGDIIK